MVTRREEVTNLFSHLGQQGFLYLNPQQSFPHVKKLHFPCQTSQQDFMQVWDHYFNNSHPAKESFLLSASRHSVYRLVEQKNLAPYFAGHTPLSLFRAQKSGLEKDLGQQIWSMINVYSFILKEYISVIIVDSNSWTVVSEVYI